MSPNVRSKNSRTRLGIRTILASLSRASIRLHRYRCYTGNSCRNPREPQSYIDDMANVERGPRVAAQGRTGSIHHGYPQRDAEIPSQLVSSDRRVPLARTSQPRHYTHIYPICIGPRYSRIRSVCISSVQRPSRMVSTKVSLR